MAGQSPTQCNDIINVEGNTLIFKVGEYRLSIKIEGPEVKPGGRLQLEAGQTLFDLVLDAARTMVTTPAKGSLLRHTYTTLQKKDTRNWASEGTAGTLIS